MRMIQTNIHLILAFVLSGFLFSCSSSGTESTKPPESYDSLTVIPVVSKDVKRYQSYNAIIQGENDIDIRSQVAGTITAIYAQEGDYVHKGDKLFQIDNRPFLQALNRARANLTTVKAIVQKVTIEKERIERLAENKVVSEVQLNTSKAEYNEALGQLRQAEAAVSAVTVDLGYTTITAPSDGYIGLFRYKTGSLVEKNDPAVLTRLSLTKNSYVYFSMSEHDFNRFKDTYQGNTTAEKLRNVPPVELLLSGNALYQEKGKLDMVAGQFDSKSGMVTLRAFFKNKGETLRSGTIGKIRLVSIVEKAIVIPQKATFDLQDKTFVFVLLKGNKVERRLIDIKQAIPNYYLINSGLKPEEKIVLTGVDKLKDGMQIYPQHQPFDSLLVRLPLP